MAWIMEFEHLCDYFLLLFNWKPLTFTFPWSRPHFLFHFPLVSCHCLPSQKLAWTWGIKATSSNPFHKPDDQDALWEVRDLSVGPPQSEKSLELKSPISWASALIAWLLWKKGRTRAQTPSPAKRAHGILCLALNLMLLYKLDTSPLGTLDLEMAEESNMQTFKRWGVEVQTHS